MTALPTKVIEQDHRLQKASEDLVRLRWHWTLDETNPDRVSFREYARQVGRDERAIRMMANGYAAFMAADAEHALRTPGSPHTVYDFVKLAGMGAERQEAVKAVAKATGAGVSNVAVHKRGEVDAVLSTARERALERGTTVDHEVHRSAQWREKARVTARRETDDRKARSTARFIEIEGHVGAAMQRLRKVLDAAADVDFTEEEKELLAGTLGKLHALLNLIDLRITGTTGVDWDAELQKLVN